jgi:phosphoribosyl 1,2-cyclic phosphodiesterase
MGGRFTVLASGSSGNAALLEAQGFGVLIDCGLQPRLLTSRLREAGASWDRVNAVLLTHIHGDHWKDRTLADLRSRGIPLYAHSEHLDYLNTASLAFTPLRKAGLARTYTDADPIELATGLVVSPVRVSHDAEPTFAFRIDQSDAEGLAWSVGYASDLGCGSPELIEMFSGVDVLAIEFNHDVRMEKRSRRPRYLIDRVLGDSGHLSNEQAGELAAAIASRSGDRCPRHLVQLHLSRQCNRPELASAAGTIALAELNPGVEVTTARQDSPARAIALGRREDSLPRQVPQKSVICTAFRRTLRQQSLPGFEG